MNMLLVIHDLQLDLRVILSLLSPSSLSLSFSFLTCTYMCVCVCVHLSGAYYTLRAQLNILLTKTEGGRD